MRNLSKLMTKNLPIFRCQKLNVDLGLKLYYLDFQVGNRSYPLNSVDGSNWLSVF